MTPVNQIVALGQLDQKGHRMDVETAVLDVRLGRDAHPTLRGRLGAHRQALLSAARHSRATFVPSLIGVLIVQGVTMAAVVPAIAWLFRQALAHASITNVTDRTLGVLMGDPVADLLIAVIILLMFASVVALLAVVIAISGRRQEQRPLDLRGIFRDTVANLRAARHPQAPLLMIYVLVVVPLTGFGAFSVITRDVAIPPFVTGEFLKSPLSTLVYSAAFGALLYVNARLIYTIPALFVGRLSPIAAMRLSVRMSRRRLLHVVAAVAVPTAFAFLVSSGITQLVVAYASLNPGEVLVAIAVGGAKVVSVIAVSGALATTMNALLAEVRATLIGPRELRGTFVASPPAHRLRRIAAATVSVGTLFGFALVSPSAALAAPVPAAAGTVILAHRGDIWGGVENTIGALEAAARSHPDYVEVDVQETRDQVFIASHDTNLLVDAGINRNIFDMDAREVTATVVREHGFTATIPTMAEYVSRARALGVPLLIEIKVHGHEQPGYVDRFLATLDALGATDHEIYHSLDPETVVQLKRARPDLRVGLTIAMSIGGVPNTPADFFVIEQASFTVDFLAQAHRLGKRVYVWTVDDDARIRSLLREPVDGIVTDQPRRAIALRSELAAGVTSEEQAVEALHRLTAFQ